MTTLREEPKSALGKRLQAYRADRPDEWSMDDFTRMAEELQQKLEATKAELNTLKSMLPKIKANAIMLAANCVNGIDLIKYDDLISFAESIGEGK